NPSSQGDLPFVEDSWFKSRLAEVRGLSSGTVLSRNLTGIVKISGKDTSGIVTFDTREDDPNYHILLGTEPSADSPGVFAWVKNGTKTDSGFHVQLSSAPGPGNNV